MKRLFVFIVFLISHILCMGYDSFDERIISYNSIINIQKDSSVIVEEIIKVFSTGNVIKRGIFRDFPTTYWDNLKNKYVVGFEIIDIKHNGLRESFYIESLSNGKRIYIGKKDKIITRGIHTYTIKYRTTRQIGFFKNFDELYWNVTGNGWMLPIEKAVAIVNLPKEIPENSIDFNAFTGYLDSKEKNVSINRVGTKIIFETNKELKPYQGLTLDVVWKKGFITEPNFYKKFFYFLQDNKTFIWLLISFLIVLIYYLFVYIKIKNPIKETIIPIFEPPMNYTPGEIRFINNMTYDDKIFTADVLDMAVKGLLKIEYKKHEYSLIKNNSPNKDDRHFYVWNKLFASNDMIVLNKLNSNKINFLIGFLKNSLYFNFQTKYFASHSYLLFGYFLSALLNMPMFFSSFGYMLIAALLFCFINILFSHLLKQYTDAGNKIKAEIQGFKMFLCATEQERINFFSSTDQTPEQFELYLPYAVALDCEKKWTTQFKKVFDKLKQQNIQYVPNWYVGSNFNFLNASLLSSEINHSIKNIVSSSTVIPGSTSGFGGKGSSGRGGGGGGGGGW